MLQRLFVAAIAAVVVLGLTVQADAQRVKTRKLNEAEVRKEAPYYWVITGDSPDDMKFELKLNFKLDQSTAEKCVESYCALQDKRMIAEGAYRIVNHRRPQLLYKGMLPYQQQLVHPDTIAGTYNPCDEKISINLLGCENPRLEPTVIVDSAKQDDGGVCVETSQPGEKILKRDTEYDREAGGVVYVDLEVEKIDLRHRYYCVQDKYGNWQIDRVEDWYVPPAVNGDEMPAGQWVAGANPIGYYVWWEQLMADAPQKVTLKNSTAREAAESVYSWLVPIGWRMDQEIAWAADKLMYAYLRKLTTKRIFNEERMRARLSLAEFKAPEFDKETKLEGGEIEIRFKKREDDYGAHAVRVKKVGGRYLVTKVGSYVKYDNLDEEQYYPSGIYYTANWE